MSGRDGEPFRGLNDATDSFEDALEDLEGSVLEPEDVDEILEDMHEVENYLGEMTDPNGEDIAEAFTEYLHDKAEQMDGVDANQINNVNIIYEEGDQSKVKRRHFLYLGAAVLGGTFVINDYFHEEDDEGWDGGNGTNDNDGTPTDGWDGGNGTNDDDGVTNALYMLDLDEFDDARSDLTDTERRKIKMGEDQYEMFSNNEGPDIYEVEVFVDGSANPHDSTIFYRLEDEDAGEENTIGPVSIRDDIAAEIGEYGELVEGEEIQNYLDSGPLGGDL